MLHRKIEKDIESFFKSDKSAMLITGARQVGKTFIIRELCKKNYKNFVEINFLENKMAKALFEKAQNTTDILLAISTLSNIDLESGNTIVFLDEIQDCADCLTAIKFLVEDKQYKYILSGSLLGVDFKDIRSLPIGYLTIKEMYPLDFKEFLTALSVSNKILKSLETSFENCIPIYDGYHQKLMDLFYLYLMIGGMPEVVNIYLKEKNLRLTLQKQQEILSLYKKDISKYDKHNKLLIEDVFDLIPSELNNPNKRFILKDLNKNFKFSNYRDSFIYLKDAGVALPTYNVTEPTTPLLKSKSRNLFKLFLSDVGLLSSYFGNKLQQTILLKQECFNFGSIYENYAACQLKANGFDLFYYNNKKWGEVDFLIEQNNKVIPIEIKSGKDYKRHNALSNLLSIPDYAIDKAYVFSNQNISVKDKIIYYPIYLLMFLKKDELVDLFYNVDLSILK